MKCETSTPNTNPTPLLQENVQESFEPKFLNETFTQNDSKAKPQPFKTTKENTNPLIENESSKQSPQFLSKKLQPDKKIRENYLDLLISAADDLLKKGVDINHTSIPLSNGITLEFLQRKCSNEICPVMITKASQLFKAKIKQKEQSLCLQCHQAWKKGQFCYYCGIIYREYKGTKGFNQHKSWVGCDYCNNWEHIKCEEDKGEYTNLTQLIKNNKFKYKCPICRKGASNGNNHSSRKDDKHRKNSSISSNSYEESKESFPIISHQTKEEFDREYEKISKPLKLKNIKSLLNGSDIKVKEFINDIEAITSLENK